MEIFGSLSGLFGDFANSIASINNDSSDHDVTSCLDHDWITASCDDTGSINPANGLPMVGAVDIEGNPFGTDGHHDSFDNDVTSCLDHDWSTSICDDSWSSSCFDD